MERATRATRAARRISGSPGFGLPPVNFVRPAVALVAGGCLIALVVALVEVARGEAVNAPLVLAATGGLALLMAVRLSQVIAELHRSEARGLALWAPASEAMLITDRGGRVVEVNAAACTFLGYPRDGILGLTIADLTSPVVNPGQAERLERIRSGSTVVSELSARRPDGSLVPVELTASRLSDRRLQLIVRDITGRRAAEAARDRLAAAIEQTRDIVMMSGLDGRIVYVNTAFATATGYSPSEVIGQPISSLPADPGHEQEMSAIETAIASGQSWAGPVFIRRADGRPLELEVVISPTRDPSGAIGGSVQVARDVSRQRELEAQLRQAQKMEAVGRLAGGIAHDFNNLLGAIRGYAELTHLAANPGDEVHAFSAEVLKAADRAKILTHRLLAFARQSPANPATVDLNHVIRDLQPMLRQIVDERTRLTVDLTPSPVFARVDVALLEQAVLNLVINARDAIAARGTIHVSTGFKTIGPTPGRRMGTDLAPGRYAVLAVTDTGHGIPPEALSHLFEPFYTTKPAHQGTGLGLSTVQAVVTGVGGTVMVDSRPGDGARFELLFPLVDQVAEVAIHPPAAVARRLRGKESVLLVEDEPSMSALLSRILSEQGYRVTEAQSAERALEIVGSGRPPALVITDILLPNTSGPDLAEALRERFPGLPVMFISGYEPERLVRDGGLGPDSVFLAKPFAAVEFLGAVRTVLDRRPLPAPGPVRETETAAS